ncbi:hypothetical protein Nepgr_006235 [Nepenthes gracilis]|uniref:Uncharacterized protein n=1 Tax=Nepenthes gracilis TaxID=150966 RepID=A0AAD3XHE3_NEPGR|nr:hypothetical protein Nepgr_006235 [Nepenthes gracilis]
MSSTNNTSSTQLRCVNSAKFHLFVGVALMMGLIAVALLILACSYRNQPSSSTASDAKGMSMIAGDVDAKPEIVVIMPGDDKPTFLAKPTSSSYSCDLVNNKI